MSLKRPLVAKLAVVTVVIGGMSACGSSVPGSSAGGGNASLANAYLATGSYWVSYLQWNSSGTGSLTDDTLSGTAPDEQVSSDQTPVTVYVNGSEVTFTGLTPQNGTLANGQLTLQVLRSDGTLGTDTFTPATQGQFNAAVQALQAQAASDNSAAVQQQAQASSASASAAASASQAAANAAAEQQAQTDLSAVQGISFTSDLNKISGDLTQTGNDLATEKTAAAAGPNADGGNCYNLESNVDYDATSVVNYDVQETMNYDVQYGGLVSDISSARGAISGLQEDVSSLSAAGLPVPSGAQAAITAAQNTVSGAVSTANSYISQGNADVNTAYAVANGIATGGCVGPGSPPSGITPVS